MAARRTTHTPPARRTLSRSSDWLRLLALVTVLSLVAVRGASAGPSATLLSANFNTGTDGFTYLDDPFDLPYDTSQPGYASGTRTTTGGYGSSGGLQVSLGGINSSAITGMSGGWSYTLNLAAEETGVLLSFRYRLEQAANYEYDEYSRVLVSVDGTGYGRGSKRYVDHVGGDGTAGNAIVKNTEWQQHQIYLGTLAAGIHTLILGGYNNHKDASDESTAVYVDDVLLTSGNAAPVPSDAQTLVNRLDLAQFKTDIQTVAGFGDRCRLSGCSPYTSFYNAQNWVEQQLQAMGYATQKHVYSTGSNLYATKVGTLHPENMYIVSNMLDGRGGGGAADDDASGVALTLEVARVLAAADVQTDVSVRFIFFDQEEGGLIGSAAYVAGRKGLRGIENPAGSGQYPEPNWAGVIQHDMILYDHGVSSPGTSQSPYADLDVEWTAGATFATQSMALAQKWRYVNGTYAVQYPANSADGSQSTDDYSFRNYCPAVSVRENRRCCEWVNPYYHTSNDRFVNYNADDFNLGFNAVQTTLGTVAELAGAHIVTANNPPVANPQSATTPEDTAKAINLTGSDADGDPLTYHVVSGPSHGSLSGSAPDLTYTPAADYNGPDGFDFVVNDGQVDSTPATVSISVTPVNDPPVANPQSVATAEDTPVAITLSAYDADGDPLTYSVVSAPSHGSLSGSAPDLTYTPAADYNGPDGFGFVVNDGQVDSAPATVSITVNPVNDPPVANPQSLTTAEDTPVGITLSGYDVEGDPLSYSVASGPSHGSLSGTAPNLTYTPAANYNGLDSFTFWANDGTADSAPATVSISVTPVNDPPVANAQSVATACNTPVGITLTGSDVEGDGLTFGVASGPGHGSLSGTAPYLTYAPVTGYSGDDSFTFVATDGKASSAPATVSIVVGECGGGLPVPFADDFESDLGWTVNPAGTDSARSGAWERADPQPTDDGGPKQLGDATSGSYDLVTGALSGSYDPVTGAPSGSTAGRFDLDGGVTSIRSPAIQLPTGQDITLSLNYYFAHARNASPADYFRVRVAGASTATVLEVRGNNTDVNAAWAPFSVSLNSFAGQVVTVLIEAADLSRDSLVEAGVDDVSITAAPSSAPRLAANFDAGDDGFSYADDAFRGTSQPDYASGTWLASGGYSGGGLQVMLGGIDTQIVEGMSGGWQDSFSLAAPAEVRLSFWCKLTQSPDYESDECSQVLASVDAVVYSSETEGFVAEICGNGNGGSEESTGWQLFSASLGTLSAGSHTLTVGGYNNQKSYTNEWTEILVDEVTVATD